jgi:hypothetical protein
MIAKIGRGESLFGALIYNYNKVGEGAARIISGNRMIGGVTNIPENAMQRMMLSFEPYLAANQRTAKPILHISLNPSPEDRLTDERFAALAADYMEKMGYGDQPYVVFMHEDTGRRHIHIVSTCVDENGRRIFRDFEKRKSMEVCRELERKYGLANAADQKHRLTEPRLKKVDHTKGDVKHQISNTLKGVLGSYKFQTFGEYGALLSCYNVEAKQVRGEYEGVPYAGIVYTATDGNGNPAGPPFKSSLFGKQFGHEGLTRKMERHAQSFRQKKWAPKIHDAVRLATITCRGDRERFEKTLHGKGIDVLFRKNADGRIYGVTFIDHNAREVYNGSRLGKEYSANAFERLFTEPARSRREGSEQGQARPQEPSDGIAALFGIDVSNHAEPELYEEPILKKKRKKKKGRYIPR